MREKQERECSESGGQEMVEHSLVLVDVSIALRSYWQMLKIPSTRALMESTSHAMITRGFSQLMFEKRLSLIGEGFCPYCEVALGERVTVNDVVRSRCSCCGGLYKTRTSGPGWSSFYGRDCAHTHAWAPDEATERPRMEKPECRLFVQGGRWRILWR